MANLFQETSGARLPNWLGILILTQLLVATIAQPDCIQCGDFNRVQPQGCAQDYTQCGDCLTNYFEYVDDPHFCSALRIAFQSGDEKTGEIGSYVFLDCKFNTKVDCKWSKDGEEVKDFGPLPNRKWMTTDGGENTYDCTLGIENLIEEDAGSWVCSNRANRYMKEISSKPIQLNIKSRFAYSQLKSGCIRCEDFNRVQPWGCAQDYTQCGDCLTNFFEYVDDPHFCSALKIAFEDGDERTEEIGSEVIFFCKFNTRVYCKWSKDGEEVKDIGPFPNRKWMTDVGAYTDDCTLIIRHLIKEDAGTWVCSNWANRYMKEISSQPIQLNIKPRCIRCEDFNRVQPEGCAQDYTQCGGCLTNFFKGTKDHRFCSALEIVFQDGDEITEEIGSEVIFFCKFNTEVDCKWSKDGEDVKDIGPFPNRRWMTDGGENTEYCTLVIRHLIKEDVGTWVCSNRANYHLKEVSSRPKQLNIKLRLMQSPEASYVIEEGDSITIPCKFDQKVICSWTRNDSPVSNSENYYYAAVGADCSLTIARASIDEDSGDWKCTAKRNTSRESVSADSTTLIVVKIGAKSEPPTTSQVSGPLIYYGSEVVNGATLMYPGDNVMMVLLSLHCDQPNNVSSKLWWMTGDNGKYEKQFSQSLNLGPESREVIVRQLQQQNKVELICMAEDENRHISTASVFFIKGGFPAENGYY